MRAPLPLALCATLLTHGVARGTDLEAPLRANYVKRGMIAEKTADVNLSEPLRYLQAGPASSKRLVVLLHGMVFTADTWKWVGTIDALAEAGFRVVALELKHYAGEYASEAVRTSLLRSFLKALGWPASPRSVLVVAASAGGSVGAPFVLDPKTAPSVAGYVSVSALGIRGNASGPSSVPALLVWGALDQPTSAKEQAHERRRGLRVIPPSSRERTHARLDRYSAGIRLGDTAFPTLDLLHAVSRHSARHRIGALTLVSLSRRRTSAPLRRTSCASSPTRRTRPT